MAPLGIYISVPFCKAKCTYCNFASGVFAPERMQLYVDRLCAEIHAAHTDAARLNAGLPTLADSIFFGGGTPSLLSAHQMRQIFTALRAEFELAPDAEITLECAPGQLEDRTLDELLGQGLNRISFGVQSFIDKEAVAVGRLHTRQTCLAEIARMRAAGLANINLDLIAGLPHQTEASWQESVSIAIETSVPHLSIYMLEVDDDSRLGREMLAHGPRYSASETPTEDDTADFYASACTRLEDAAIPQYEISNFARAGHASRHNIKYWQRQPYLGFGLDAHSMLPTRNGAIRRANTSDLDAYLTTSVPELFPRHATSAPHIDTISHEQAFEESLFLGLRMNHGIDLDELRAEFGEDLIHAAEISIEEIEHAGLVQREATRLRLTPRGRMVSNEVFSRLLLTQAV